MLPKESEPNKNNGSDGTSAVVNNDGIMEQISTCSDDSPKLEQLLLDSLAAASSTSVISNIGFQNFGANSAAIQSTSEPPEMPQLMSILNELLDGQDLTTLANTGGNGDNMPDMVDQEENYEYDSPRKDDPEELTRLLVQQRLEEIRKNERTLQRKMEFFVRRLYKVVARSTGHHTSEEITDFLEQVARQNKSKEKEVMTKIGSKFPCLTANLQGVALAPPVAPTLDFDKSSLSPPFYYSSKGETGVNEQPSKNLKPIPVSEMKSFLRRVECLSSMQSTMINKRAHSMKYFAKPSMNSLSAMTKSETNLLSSTLLRFKDNDIEKLDQVSGLLMSEMRLIENQIDSDATASSSGGESADEMVSYNNHYQQSLSIGRRTAYRYAKDRGAVASRWCWLATQISELDYKIRQHIDLKKHIKDNKGLVVLQEVSGTDTSKLSENASFDHHLNGTNCQESAARVRPIVKTSFRKRKLVQISNLHQFSKKAGRSSSLKCGCQWPLPPCALCTGRVDPTAFRDLPDILPTSERVALLDPGFHAVLSFPDDVANNIHFEAIMNITEWQSKMIRSSPKSIMKHATKQLEMLGPANNINTDEKSLQNLVFTSDDKKIRKVNIDILTGKRKYTKKLLKLEGVLSSKMKERKKHRKRGSGSVSPHVPRKYTFKKRIRKINNNNALALTLQNNYQLFPNGITGSSEKHFEPIINRSKNSSPILSARNEKKHAESRSNRNYDIDNIVIPYSVAASTRVEVLSYKEIPTPKWKIITDDDENEQLSVEREHSNESGEMPEMEDISDECLIVKHDKALLEERRKFETYLKFPLTSRSRANRRIDSRGNDSSGANTPITDPTSPAPVVASDIESSPFLMDAIDQQEQPSITALFNSFNGRKDRTKTLSKKEEIADGGVSGTASRCSSPELVKEIIPAYEPLHFPLTDLSIQRMKRVMPHEHLRQVERYFNIQAVMKTGKEKEATSHKVSMKRRPCLGKKRKHNDSISESKLIKEMLPSSSLATIGKRINVLIPRNSQNILESIDLTVADGAVIKQLMNNNNGDSSLNCDDYETEDNANDSDSETVTGDESFGADEESDSDEYVNAAKLHKKNQYNPHVRFVD